MEDIREINQVDLTSSLSFLFGSPPPHGNLGQIIPELFSAFPYHFLEMEGSQLPFHESAFMSGMANLTVMRFLNAIQLFNYLHNYSEKTRQFPTEFMSELRLKFQSLRSQFGALTLPNMEISPEAWAEEEVAAYLQFHSEFSEFYKFAIEMCHKLWTSFDEPHMVIGAVIFTISTVIGLLFSFIEAFQEIRFVVPLAVVISGAVFELGFHISNALPFAWAMAVFLGLWQNRAMLLLKVRFSHFLLFFFSVLFDVFFLISSQ